MESKRGTKHAVVLSGGGANGAYEVGVLKALVAGKSNTTNYEPLDPDIFLGTSVGSYNAAFLVSQWPENGRAAVANLEEVWREKIPGSFLTRTGAFRIRGNPVGYVDPRNYYPSPLKPLRMLADDVLSVGWDSIQRGVNVVAARDTPLLERFTNLLNLSTFVSVSPFEKLIADTIQFDKFRSNPKQLRIAATNWGEGKVDIYNEHDMSAQLGPDIIRASSAIPGILPEQHVGSELYVDGGVLMNTPLMPAIEAGADVIHVITLNPAVEKIPLSVMSNQLSTTWRQQVIGWVKAVDSNIHKIWALNRTLELGRMAIEGVKKEIMLDKDKCFTPREAAADADPEEQNVRFKVDEGIWDEIRNYRPLTVYLYRPRDDIGGPLGLLNFGRSRIKALIERGFNDAVHFVRTDATYVPPYPVHHKVGQRELDQQRFERLKAGNPEMSAAE